MKKIGLMIISLLWVAISRAQEMEVPVNIQYPLFLKILTFDRNLKNRLGEELVMGIVYQTKFRRSLTAKDELVKMMKESPIKKIEEVPIRWVLIDLSDGTELASAISRNKVDILYITPLRAVGIDSICSISRAKKILTLTGVPDYVQSGLAAVGIGIKSEKPLILINLPAAKAEGADFSSQLLKLAEVLTK